MDSEIIATSPKTSNAETTETTENGVNNISGSTEADQVGLVEKFNSTVLEFVREIQTTFPELNDTIEERYSSLNADDETVLQWFVTNAEPHHMAITTKDSKLFKEHDALFLLPDINFSQLWKCKLTKTNKCAIWKYLHVLLLLVSHMQLRCAAASASASVLCGPQHGSAIVDTNSNVNTNTGEGDGNDTNEWTASHDATLKNTFEQWEHMLSGAHLTEDEMAKMKTHADSMMRLMHSLSQPDDANKDSPSQDEDEDDDSSEEDCDEHKSSKDTTLDPNAFAEKLRNDPFLKQLESSKIAQFAQELSSELNMDDLGISPDAKLESFQDVFGVLGKNPNGIMGLVQSVGNKIQNKMQSGDIKQTDLVTEAHTLMKSMQGSPAFREMMQAMGGKNGRRRGGRGRNKGGGGGVPGFDPQKIFQMMAKQMSDFQPTPEDIAAMEKMMGQASMSSMSPPPNSSALTRQANAPEPTSTRKENGNPKKRKGKKKKRTGPPPPDTSTVIASEGLD